MVAISFSSESFIQAILDGTKITTIRKTNLKREVQMYGLGIHLYYKQRTKQCRFISHAMLAGFDHLGDIQDWLATAATEDDAKADGFSSLEEMREFFKRARGNFTKIRFLMISKEEFDAHREWS